MKLVLLLEVLIRGAPYEKAKLIVQKSCFLREPLVIWFIEKRNPVHAVKCHRAYFPAVRRPHFTPDVY